MRNLALIQNFTKGQEQPRSYICFPVLPLFSLWQSYDIGGLLFAFFTCDTETWRLHNTGDLHSKQYGSPITSPALPYYSLWLFLTTKHQSAQVLVLDCLLFFSKLQSA